MRFQVDRHILSNRIKILEKLHWEIGVRAAGDIMFERSSGEDAEFQGYARVLFDALAEGLVICEAIHDARGALVDYWIRDANPIFLSRAPEGVSVIGHNLLALRPGTSPWWFDQCARALNGEDVRFEFEDPTTRCWYDAHMMRLSERRFAQFFMDITERKMAEQRQAELFSELNHRVKNNLAITASILELQAKGAPEEVRAPLLKAIGRVRTIGDLHAVLYQQNSTDKVDLSAYLGALCAGLREALLSNRIKLDIQCEQAEVAVQQAVSLGLIVNELVTNAAKHAFPEGAEGTVEVVLRQSDAGLALRVSDDGVGLREGPVGGLGVRMVRALAKSLNAETSVQSERGFAVEVIFPT